MPFDYADLLDHLLAVDENWTKQQNQVVLARMFMALAYREAAKAIHGAKGRGADVALLDSPPPRPVPILYPGMPAPPVVAGDSFVVFRAGRIASVVRAPGSGMIELFLGPGPQRHAIELGDSPKEMEVIAAQTAAACITHVFGVG